MNEPKIAIENVGKNFSADEMLTCDAYVENDLLREIWQLSQIISKATQHNQHSRSQIVHVSFGYS